MAELPAADRIRIYRGLMRWWSNEREAVGITKAELQAAVDATDTWIDDNQAAYNSALPTAARDNLTTTQKTFLFCVVALMRVGVGFLQKIVGEVN